MLLIIESFWGYQNIDVRDVIVGAIGRKLDKSFQREGPGKSYKHGQLTLKRTPTAWWRAYSESLGVPWHPIALYWMT